MAKFDSKKNALEARESARRSGDWGQFHEAVVALRGFRQNGQNGKKKDGLKPSPQTLKQGMRKNGFRPTTEVAAEKFQSLDFNGVRKAITILDPESKKEIGFLHPVRDGREVKGLNLVLTNGGHPQTFSVGPTGRPNRIKNQELGDMLQAQIVNAIGARVHWKKAN